MNHLYAQYFHPHTLLERVRDVAFIRRPRTLFKGFTVPDWATSEKMNKWEFDAYSRKAWDQAMHEFHSEATPVPFFGERLDPNPLQWFRLEQFGKGNSSRLYYNEVPETWWNRSNGRLDPEQKEDLLYSFTHADQSQEINFGIDTSTEEGRAQYKAEFDALCQMTPEILNPEQMLYPHEMKKKVSSEAHFQRIWGHYRDYSLRTKIENSVSSGSISRDEADSALKFLGQRNTLSVSQYLLAKKGLRPDLENDSGYLAADKALESIGHDFKINEYTAEDYESQFWSSFDNKFNLTEVEMRESLPQFISDPSNRYQA